MKKNKLGIILFLTVLIAPTVIWLLIGLISPGTKESLDFELGEKREKTQIESINQIAKDGNLLSDYVSDRAPFRSVAISFCQRVSNAVEGNFEKKIVPKVAGLLYGKDAEAGTKEVSSDAFASLFDDGEKLQAEMEQSGEQSPDNEQEQTHIHDYKTVSETLPTCTEDGERKLRCEECGDEITEVLSATGHTLEVVSVTEASYTSYGYTDYECSVCGAKVRDDFVDKLIDNSYFAPNHHGEATIIGRYNWLFLDGYGNLPYYKATNILSAEDMQAYLDKLEEIQTLCDEKGIEFAVIISPNKDQVYSEYMPSYTVEDEYKRTERFVDFVKANSDIAITYPIDELKYADRYWQTYYRYDTHWNKMGGFIGTMALYSALGMEVTNPLDLNIEPENVAQKGDLFALGAIDPAGYPDDYDFNVSYKDEISMIKENGGVYTWFSESDNENGKSLVLLGDSYRDQMTPYLKKDFTKCAIVHRDYIETVVNDIKNADVLVLQAVERYDKRLFQYHDRLIEILGQIEVE